MDPTQVPLPEDIPGDNLMGINRKKKNKKYLKRKNNRWFNALRARVEEESKKSDHWFHNGLGREIEILSEDNVRFKVSSSNLANHSTLFSDILSDTAFYDSSARPIDIPYPSNTVEIFIDLISVANRRPILKNLDLDAVESLLPFLDYAQCTELLKEVRQRLLKISKNQDTSLLMIASDLNDVGLAKIALRRFRSDTTYTYDPDNLARYRGFIGSLRPSFQVELLSLIMVDTKSDNCRKDVRNNIDWNWIAKNFNPDGREEVTDEEDVSTDEEMKSKTRQANQVNNEIDWSAEPPRDSQWW